MLEGNDKFFKKFYLFAFLLFLDQISKALAIRFLKLTDSISIWGSFFQLTYVENSGSAFGSFQNQNTKLLVFSFLAIFFLLYVLKTSKSYWEQAGYLLVLTGAVGNIVDRIRHGFVIDFLDFDFFDIYLESLPLIGTYELDRWPVFNFADSYICVGVFLVFLSLIVPVKNPSNS